MSLISSSHNGHGQQPDVSIIIPVFNGLDLTRASIEALLKDRSLASFEIIVVDNGSTDGVQDFLKALGDQIILLKPGGNLGFAKANNLAAQRARGRHLLLLNNDTVPEKGWLDEMVRTAESDERIAVVGCKLVYPETRLIQHAGVAVSQYLKVYHIYEYFPEDHPLANKRRDYQIVTAACMLIKRSVFGEVGGFNEGFVNGFEDVDLCLRIRERGWRVVYEPQAVVQHHTGRSTGRHQYELQNSLLLTRLWRHKMLSDEADYYNEDGYAAVSLNGRTVWIVAGLDAPALLDQARSALKENRLADALAVYQRLYHASPTSSEIVHYLALIYEKQGDWAKATVMLKCLVALDPNAAVQSRLAHAALKQGDYETAKEYAAKALAATSYDSAEAAEALTVMGDAAFKQKRFDEAAGHYDAALEIHPKNERALTGRGSVDLSRGNNAAALPIFQRAIQIGGGPRAYLGKALSLMGLGNNEEALACFAEALDREPDNSFALATVLPLLNEAGRLEEASDRLERYLSRYPDDKGLTLALAGVAYALGRFEHSRKLMNRLKEFSPDYPGVDDLERELDRVSPQFAEGRDAVPA